MKEEKLSMQVDYIKIVYNYEVNCLMITWLKKILIKFLWNIVN